MFRVLLVDDSPLMRQFVARTLEMTGLDIEVQEAENGRVAIRAAQASRPDLIITDLNMPELSGEELLLHLATDEQLSDLPVIIMTADSERCRVGRLQKNQKVLAYMEKPVQTADLRHHIEALIAPSAQRIV